MMLDNQISFSYFYRVHGRKVSHILYHDNPVNFFRQLNVGWIESILERRFSFFFDTFWRTAFRVTESAESVRTWMETYARRVFAGDGNTLKDDGEIGGSGG